MTVLYPIEFRYELEILVQNLNSIGAILIEDNDVYSHIL